MKCPGPPPWKPIYTAEIKTSLLDDTANKNTAPHILTTCTYETIENYPKTIIHAFTDGSAFKATTFAGFGVFLKYPDKTSFHWSEPCGNTCSNYIAEVKAITSAIGIIHQQFETEEKTHQTLSSSVIPSQRFRQWKIYMTTERKKSKFWQQLSTTYIKASGPSNSTVDSRALKCSWK